MQYCTIQKKTHTIVAELASSSSVMCIVAISLLPPLSQLYICMMNLCMVCLQLDLQCYICQPLSGQQLVKPLVWSDICQVISRVIISSAQHPTKPWFANILVGKNKLKTMAKRMCEAAGLPPRTNHSLWVTGARMLFSNSVPEKLIQEITGHHSLECLRRYEDTTEQNQRAVPKCMTSGSQFKPLTESQPTLERPSSGIKLCPSM